MSSYTHFEFSAERHRLDCIKLDPPLRLVSRWCLNGVGYLPRSYSSKIFVSFMEGYINAYDKSANMLWSFSLPSSYEPLPPFDGDLIIWEEKIITRSKNKLILVNIETGELIDHHEVPEFDLEGGLVQGTRLISLYVKNWDFYCAAYDLNRKKLLWSHNIEGPPDHLVGDEKVVVLSDKKRGIICRDGSTGEQLWLVRFKDLADKFKAGQKELLNGRVSGTPIIYDKHVIVPIEKYRLAAFEIKSGKLAWIQKTEVEIPDTTTLYPDGNIYIADYKSVTTIKFKTGEIVKSLQLRESFRSKSIFMPTRLAVTDNFFYIADINNGVFVAINKIDGQIVWSNDLKTEIPFLKGPTIIGDVLFIVDLDGNLFGFSEEKDL